MFAFVGFRPCIDVLTGISGSAIRDGVLRGSAHACLDKSLELGKALDWIAVRAADMARDGNAGPPDA